MAILLIHGGAGLQEGSHVPFTTYGKHLRAIVERSRAVLVRSGAIDAVIYAVRCLEDDPLFNAGTGAKLQRDGRARMSAALMDNYRSRFAGVINVQRVRNPIQLAALLVERTHSVLAGNHAMRFARRRGIPDYDPLTSHRLREHARGVRGTSGTVGAVALDEAGVICAGTSTGGVGFESPGRVSDSPTVAGTYAGLSAGISCTGIGEQIVDHAVAARVETRVSDGTSIAEAVRKTTEEGSLRGLSYGLIAVSMDGEWSVGQTDGATTLYAVSDEQRTFSFDQT